MGRFLYSANRTDGKPEQGFIDAANASEARQALLGRQLDDVVIHNVGSLAETEALSGEPAEDDEARLRILFQQDQRFSTFMREVLWRARWELLLGLGLLAWAIYSQLIWLGCLALAALLLMVGLPVWKLRHARRYDRLIRAQAFGRWDEVGALLDALDGQMENLDGEFDLAVRRAELHARLGETELVDEVLAPWRLVLAEVAPGLLTARAASVKWAAGDYPGFLASMREAATMNPDDPVSLLDGAMAELRFGDAGQAGALLARVDQESLPPFAQPFVLWAQGLLARRRGQPDGTALLGRAFALISANSHQPANWTGIALLAGDYGLAVLDDGDHAGAARIIRPVWPILQHHAPAPMLKRIRRHFSKAASPA